MSEANREAWLYALAENAHQAILAPAGFALPERFRIGVGFPNRGGTAKRGRTIGQCWHQQHSADEAFEIIVSPVRFDPYDAAETLLHELGHAIVGLQHGHKAPFKRYCAAIGLAGKPTSTELSPELRKQLEPIMELLGPYPMAGFDPNAASADVPRKQGTRLIKCECDECGYVARTTQKWLTQVGAPHCPDHGAMIVDAGE